MKFLILMVVLLPFLSALLIHLVADNDRRKVAAFSVFGVAGALLGSFALFGLSGQASTQVSLTDEWGTLIADPLSILLSIVIAGISLVVQVYSVRYMADEAGYGRYFTLLSLITGVLLLMVAAGDLITLLVAWYLVSIFLFFLLAHNTRSHSAYRYASWTFLTYRLGDVPLVIAAMLMFHAFGTWSLPEIFAGFAENPDVETLGGYSLANAVAVLVALSAFARSAQFLLHTWLPYTMEGPTPVSALMHAGIVNAGGFLINRFSPVFIHTDGVLQWVFIVGLITAVIGSLLMLIQNDIKKALGYSTMGQMGFMIMECGVGAFSLAIFHMIAHGVFKGTLFLGSGSVINEARKDDGIPKDSLYKFVVQRSPVMRRQPWLLMAIITVLVPVAILVLAHWVVDQNVLQKQGAVVLLFFGWITGAQLIFVTYRMKAENIWRLMGLVIFSFVIVVLGYVLVSHAFDLYLYPDQAFRQQIYAAADIDVGWFNVLVGLIVATIILGWVMIYYREHTRPGSNAFAKRVWLNFYTLVSREFYISDFYVLVSRKLVALASKINARLWWV